MTTLWETDIRDFCGIRCRIQIRLCSDGAIQQRHIWYRTSAGDYDPPKVDPWIDAGSRNLTLVTRNMRPAAAQPLTDRDLIVALRAIAEGHNDARGLAADVLARYSSSV